MQLRIDHRKVQLDDEIAVPFFRGMLADVQIAIKFIELILVQHVIVVMQHGHGEALSEPSGTDEEEKLVGLFHRGDETGLIDKIAIVFAYIHKVHHTIRYSFTVVTHSLLV